MVNITTFYFYIELGINKIHDKKRLVIETNQVFI